METTKGRDRGQNALSSLDVVRVAKHVVCCFFAKFVGLIHFIKIEFWKSKFERELLPRK
jgi:hypothetical protein